MVNISVSQSTCSAVFSVLSTIHSEWGLCHWLGRSCLIPFTNPTMYIIILIMNRNRYSCFIAKNYIVPFISSPVLLWLCQSSMMLLFIVVGFSFNQALFMQSMMNSPCRCINTHFIVSYTFFRSVAGLNLDTEKYQTKM